jgi:hypothetical protein
LSASKTAKAQIKKAGRKTDIVAPGEIVPPEDTVLTVPTRFSLEGEKMRWEKDDQQWSADKKAFVLSPYYTCFDSAVAKTLHPLGAPGMPWPRGVVHKDSLHPEARSPQLYHLLMTFRAMTPSMRFYDLEQMELTGQTPTVQGKPCVELLRSEGKFAHRLWLDPARDYVIVRYLKTENDHAWFTLDVRFRSDSKHGWVPESWDMVTYAAPGKLQSSFSSKMTEYEFGATFQPGEFDIVFPPGARVSDMKSKKEYVIKPDGEVRTILREDLGATYEQLIKTAPGEALGKQPASVFSSFGLLHVLALMTVMATVAGLFWRRFRKRSP